jgi:phage shock protein PspC (stress-responsive transcriptional regulator)
MNEVKHIHIGRQQFTVSVEAYSELKAYLEAITKKAGESGADVAEEVELRMAELLTERGITPEKVILPKDVKFLKSQLGEPSDFSEADDEPAAKETKPEETAKRLFRDTDNAMIAGVAAGLARYFGIDAVIVRLLFVVSIFFGGAGVLAYIILWLLVPEAKTTSERLSMQGKAATVENLKRVVERADLPAAARRGSSVVAQIITVVGRIILLVIGLPLAVGSGIALLGTMAMSAYILMDGFKVAGHVVAPIGGHEVVGFIAGVVAVLCVLLFMMLIGIAMVRRRWQLPAWGVAALVGIFFLSASVGGALATDTEPGIRHRIEALHHTRVVQLESFKPVAVNGPETDFTYVPDGKNYVRYDYWGAVNVGKLQGTVKNGQLTVNTNGADPYVCDNFCPGVDPGISVEVHGPKLAALTVNNKKVDLRQTCKVMNSEEMSVDCPKPFEPLPVLVPTDNS